MCGICGTVGVEQPGLLEEMTASLIHRGPDDSGLFQDGGVGLGHRRLSIIDVAHSQQPMESPDGALVMVYNGEIYNYRELREELVARGERFETDGDTEVLLRLYMLHGADALEKLNGMFAFAVWDRGRRELFLARDRVGIKPLHYVEWQGSLLFASEVKALLRHDGWPRDLNAHAIADYLALRYVPGDVGMFSQVRRLPPGHLLRFRDGRAELACWWSPPLGDAVRRPEPELLDELGEVMERSVRRRLISDVSLGAYLSGGIDSSVIVALMSGVDAAPVKTFSVGFDYEHDELSEAAETASRLGCDHTEVACRAEDVSLLPEVVYHADDPLGDAIAIPMFQLAREAKKQVTVILTGEGGDEVFAGYLFHKVMWAADAYRRMVPGPVRSWLVAPVLRAAPASLLNLAFRYPAYLGERGKQKAVDYLDVVSGGDLEASYRHLISLFDARDTAPLFTGSFSASLEQRHPWQCPPQEAGTTFDRMLRLQFSHWLPDNMLTRNDRMSMASAVEGRVPFLDHEVIDFGFRLPRGMRLRGLVGKYLLRQLAGRLLPGGVAKRRKMPFYVPIENYFEQPAFVEMMHDLLGEDSIRRRGIFAPAAVAELRTSMQRREFVLVKQVFSLMVLELWMRTFVDGGGRAPV